MHSAATIGHNSEVETGFAADRLRSFVKRLEKLDEDKAAVTEDMREVYAEAKATGFDTRTIRQIIKERKIEVEKRREQAELLEVYKTALGMED